jgi:hypothetical protein
LRLDEAGLKINATKSFFARSKLEYLGYWITRHIPAKTPEEIPWERLCIGLIGPYKVGNPKKNDETTLHCLTMIDPVNGWFEIAEIPKKSADVVINVLDQTWLVRYP